MERWLREQVVCNQKHYAALPGYIPCASLFVDRHVLNSSVEWDNTGNSLKDSPTAPTAEKLTQI